MRKFLSFNSTVRHCTGFASKVINHNVSLKTNCKDTLFVRKTYSANSYKNIRHPDIISFSKNQAILRY